MTSVAKVILVSGGSRGLGAALVEELLGAGHAVATFSRSPNDNVVRWQRNHADNLLWSSVDSADPDALHRFVLATCHRFGRIDALVNNAGVGLDGLLTLTRPADIANAVRVNLEGPIHLTRSCVKVMLPKQCGTIVFVSSVNATHGHTGVAAYSATKAGLEGFCRSLAKEVGPSGIRVNTIAPGYFDSDMTTALTPEQRQRIVRRTPLGRLGTVGDMVSVLRFLLSDGSAFVTGQTLVVDGGLTC